MTEEPQRVRVSAKGCSKKSSVSDVVPALLEVCAGDGGGGATSRQHQGGGAGGVPPALVLKDVRTTAHRGELPAANHVIMDWSAWLHRLGVPYLADEMRALGRTLTWDTLFRERFLHDVMRVVEKGRVLVIVVDVRAFVSACKGPEQARRSADRRPPLGMPTVEAERRVGVHLPPYAAPSSGTAVPDWDCLLYNAGREYLRGIVAWFWSCLAAALPAGRPLMVIGDGVEPLGAPVDYAVGRVPRVLLCAGEGDAVRELRVPAWRNHFGEADQLLVHYVALLFVGARTTILTVDTDTYPQMLMLLDALYRNRAPPVLSDAWTFPWGVQGPAVPPQQQLIESAQAQVGDAWAGERWTLPDVLERVARQLGVAARGVPLAAATRRHAVLDTEVCVATPDQSFAASVRAKAKAADSRGPAPCTPTPTPPPRVPPVRPMIMPDFAAMWRTPAPERKRAAEAPPDDSVGVQGAAHLQEADKRARPGPRAAAPAPEETAAAAAAPAEEDTSPRYVVTYLTPLYGALQRAARRCEVDVSVLLYSIYGVLVNHGGNDYCTGVSGALGTDVLVRTYLQALQCEDYSAYIGGALATYDEPSRTWRVAPGPYLRTVALAYARTRLTGEKARPDLEASLLALRRAASPEADFSATRRAWMLTADLVARRRPAQAGWWLLRDPDHELRRLSHYLVHAQTALLALTPGGDGEHSFSYTPRVPHPLLNGYGVVTTGGGTRGVQLAVRSAVHTASVPKGGGHTSRVIELMGVSTDIGDARWAIDNVVLLS